MRDGEPLASDLARRDGEALASDITRRIGAVHGLMERHGVRVLVAVCAGAPQLNGWLRYLTGAEMWGGREFLLLTADSPRPWVIMKSTYDAEWLRQQAPSTRVDSTLLEGEPPDARTVAALRELTSGTGTIGLLDPGNLTPAEDQALRQALPNVAFTDLTDEANALRRVKSGFEVEAIEATGRILGQGLALFVERARPGRLAAEVAGEVDGYLKGQGCFWGRVTYALDQRPFTFPAAPGRRFAEDDVILLRLVHDGPHGYWFELARVFSFRPLPAAVAERLATAERAFEAARRTAVPGNTCGMVAAAANRVFADAGFAVMGAHGMACHPIGTDEHEGTQRPEEQGPFERNMVLALHPIPVLEGGHGFRLCDNVLVGEGGGRSLSGTRTFHQPIET